VKFPALKKRLPLLGLLIVFALAMSGCSDQYLVLNPKGPVGRTELKLIEESAILVGIVVIPVLLILAYIVYRYRDKKDNTAPYTPEWEDSKKLEVIWWGIPILIIAVIGWQTATTTFSLTKPPAHTSTKPIVIQVTAMDWKWVFLYPDQKIATVNYVDIPAGVPVQFQLTADAPMNSFWIPSLGGQEYAMPGMDMRLWLQADKAGEYFGTGANFSGEGFAHMQFRVESKSEADFNAWVTKVKQTAPALTKAGYDKLEKPSTEKEQSFSSYPPGTYEGTVDKNGGMNMPKMQDNMKKEETPSSTTMDPNMKGMDMGH
jgi:cytochrome aa3-600 menaquinol oxidase subunit II